MSGEEYGIYYRPEAALQSLGASRKALVRRGISILISLAVIGLAWLVWPREIGDWLPWMIGFSLASGLAWAAIDLTRFRIARRDARLANSPLAIGLNRDGIMVGTTWFSWPQVGAITVRPGRLGGATRLTVTGRDKVSAVVPLSYTDTMPASLDAAVRALSGGLAWVDLSALD